VIRSVHGNLAKSAGPERVSERRPRDEMPEGVPNPSPRVAAHSPKGQPFAAGAPATIEAARAGGMARRGTTRLADGLGLRRWTPEAEPYRAASVAFQRAQCASLKESYGGGYLDPGTRASVSLAARALAWSTYYYDTGKPKLGLQFANAVDRHLDFAREAAGVVAEARRRGGAARKTSTHQTLDALRSGSPARPPLTNPKETR
jgi:hypothetical protein